MKCIHFKKINTSVAMTHSITLLINVFATKRGMKCWNISVLPVRRENLRPWLPFRSEDVTSVDLCFRPAHLVPDMLSTIIVKQLKRPMTLKPLQPMCSMIAKLPKFRNGVLIA